MIKHATKFNEKKTKFKALCEKLAAMTPEERDAIAARMLCLVNTRGHRLSPLNSCMIAEQMPSATMVGGFRQWLEMGRVVKKGEHGMMIRVPMQKKKDANAPKKPGEQDQMWFAIGNVFDVSQTEPLPEGQAVVATSFSEA